jgi:hypothetical protein
MNIELVSISLILIAFLSAMIIKVFEKYTFSEKSKYSISFWSSVVGSVLVLITSYDNLTSDLQLSTALLLLYFIVFGCYSGYKLFKINKHPIRV